MAARGRPAGAGAPRLSAGSPGPRAVGPPVAPTLRAGGTSGRRHTPPVVARTLVSVNTGVVRHAVIAGRRVATAFVKQPVDGSLDVGPLGLAGDEQADPTVHGGTAKALYAFPSEHYPFWRAQRRSARPDDLDAPLPWGAFGENLTLTGVVETDLWIGDRLVFAAANATPGCELVVTEPRLPCFKFNAAMGWPQAARCMVQSTRCGWYLSVASPGRLQAGMAFMLLPGPRQMPLLALLRSRAARAAV